jgi:hypothetical protein
MKSLVWPLVSVSSTIRTDPRARSGVGVELAEDVVLGVIAVEDHHDVSASSARATASTIRGSVDDPVMYSTRGSAGRAG